MSNRRPAIHTAPIVPKETPVTSPGVRPVVLVTAFSGIGNVPLEEEAVGEGVREGSGLRWGSLEAVEVLVG